MSRACSKAERRSEPLIFRFTRDIHLPGWHWEGNEAKNLPLGIAHYDSLPISGKVQPFPAIFRSLSAIAFSSHPLET
ncbi:hypothetical protein IQ250_25715 [Pseudanabaenaceae cyanobacterium LEGE 13415]|nr:hypothetical protein [Pseudanabaenaceae cyanobacterium LEGE 13415]